MKYMITDYNKKNEVLYIDVEPRVYKIQSSGVKIEEVFTCDAKKYNEPILGTDVLIESDYDSSEEENSPYDKF